MLDMSWSLREGCNPEQILLNRLLRRIIAPTLIFHCEKVVIDVVAVVAIVVHRGLCL